MATLTYCGVSYTVDHAVRGADFIHGYDANGCPVVSFDGVSDFSGFTYDGTYMEPSDCAAEGCNDVKYIGGQLQTRDGTVIEVSGGNEAAFGTRGPIIITESTTFNIADYGLKIGDKVNVICIGGGGGAGGSCTSAGVGSTGNSGGKKKGYGSGGDALKSNYSGGGGGSGFFTQATVTLDAQSIAVTIGRAGYGGSGQMSGKGGNGGTTSFGSLLSASGGNGGGDGWYSTSMYMGGQGSAGGGGNSGTAGTSSAGGIGGEGYVFTDNMVVKTATENATLSSGGACIIWY